MTIQPLLLVPAPPIQPYRYGLESVAVPLSWDGVDPKPGDADHGQMGVEYEGIATYEPGVWPGTCFDAEAGSLNLPSGAGVTQGLPFSVYAGVTCSVVGYTEEYILSRARAILKLGWQHGAEQALWSGAGSSAPALTSAGTTAATGVSMTAAVGALEKYMGANYLGTAVIHAPRDAAAYLAEAHQIFERGNQLQTALGSQFVFGGGYPNTAPGGGAAGANTIWMYATGLLTARRAEPFINGDLGASLNRATNVQNVFAEQPTVLTVDGPIVAVSVDLTK